MNRIIVGNVSSRIRSADRNVYKIVKDVCRARPDGFQFMPRYRQKRWDGYINLMHTGRDFPTGLLGIVVDRLRKEHIDFQLQYEMKEAPGPENVRVSPDCLAGITLREYQMRAVRNLVGIGRGIAWMATNSGKTEVMAATYSTLSRMHGNRVLQTLVIVNRKELMYQTAERFEKRLGMEIGLLGDGQRVLKEITVAIIDSLANVMKRKGKDPLFEFFHNAEVLMVDECHHASSAQFLTCLKKLNARWRFGFSGTPMKFNRLDDLRLVAYTGRIVTQIFNEELIEKGYSAKPIVTLHKVGVNNRTYGSADYHDAYKYAIVENVERNRKIADIAEEALERGDTVLILVTRIAHGNRLTELISNSQFAHGSSHSEQRQEVLERLQKGEPFVAISTLYDEGVDVPAVRTLILAGGGKSYGRLLQRVGRGLRQKKEGENVTHVHDFVDISNPILERHSELRREIYEQEGFEIDVK